MKIARYDSSRQPGARLKVEWSPAERAELVRRYGKGKHQLRFEPTFNRARSVLWLSPCAAPRGFVASFLAMDPVTGRGKLELSIYEKSVPLIAEISPPWAMMPAECEYTADYIEIRLPTLDRRRPPRLGRAERKELRKRTEPQLL